MIFLDTSGLLCLFDASDAKHQTAKTYFDIAVNKIVTNYVVAEFVALAHARRMPRSTALEFVVDLHHSSEVMMIYLDDQLHQVALATLQSRLDKSWSRCDATSFEVMRLYKITDALTTDHHYEQAGYRSLLKV